MSLSVLDQSSRAPAISHGRSLLLGYFVPTMKYGQEDPVSFLKINSPPSFFPKAQSPRLCSSSFSSYALLGGALPARAGEDCRLSQTVELGKLSRDGIQLTAEQCTVSF